MQNDTLEFRIPKRQRVVSPSHEARWQRILINQEVIGLHKEILHLENKSSERELSDWEKERLDEVRTLLAKASNGESLAQ